MLVFDDPVFDLHDPGPGHPERRARLAAAREGIASVQHERGVARPATRDELLTVHSEAHVDRILALAGRSARLDPDTAVSARSVDAALLAAGAALVAADALLDGRRSFVLCRPPGHHATPDRAMGFCLFNNAALAAERLARAGRRVLVFDPDVHHGNGTQAAFYERGDVLYVSMHRWPFYPGTGAASETGRGPGAGATVNVPMPAGAGDEEYGAAMRERVLPALDRFRPEVGVISAGYDALDGDPIADACLSVAGLRGLWRGVASRLPCMAVLEGGYSLENLRAAVRETAGVLA